VLKRCERGPHPLLLALVALLAVIGSLATAYADDPASAKELQIERQLGCPICTNLPLNVCDNQICAQMKGVIRQKLSDGESPEQIVDYFVSRYGEGVLLTPPQQGLNLAVWYLPGIAVVAGVAGVWLLLRRSVRRQELLSRRLSATDPELERYRRRVRDDVERLN